MSRERTILLGAVAHDPKVVGIWQSLRDHFTEQDVAFEFALFSSFRSLAEALLVGAVDVAWNTALAHVWSTRESQGAASAIAMRDVDRDFQTKILVRRDVLARHLSDMQGQTLAVGSRDSVESRILPLHFLAQAGVDVTRIECVGCEADVGMHGETGRSELDVLKSLHEGQVAFGAVGSHVFQAEQAKGRIDPHQVDVFWTTPSYDRSMMDASPKIDPKKLEAFREVLMTMSWKNARHRKSLELLGLKQWVQAREEGYAELTRALGSSFDGVV